MLGAGIPATLLVHHVAPGKPHRLSDPEEASVAVTHTLWVGGGEDQGDDSKQQCLKGCAVWGHPGTRVLIHLFLAI